MKAEITDLRTVRAAKRYLRKFGGAKIAVKPERLKKYMHSHARRKAQ
jgi:hypothetical protein